MAEILLAGRDPIETQSRALLLEFMGHQCQITNSLDEALIQLQNNSSIRIVLLDEELLPAENAEAPKEFAQAVGSNAAFALLTKYSVSNSHADATLTIPCSFEEFSQFIVNLLQRGRIHPRRIVAVHRVEKPWSSPTNKRK